MWVGCEPTKEEKEGFGMMLLKFLGLVRCGFGLAVETRNSEISHRHCKVDWSPIKMLDSIPRPKSLTIFDMFNEGMVVNFHKIKTFFVGEKHSSRE